MKSDDVVAVPLSAVTVVVWHNSILRETERAPPENKTNL